MGFIFEQGDFERFIDESTNSRLNRARSTVDPIYETNIFGYKKTTVFISHKHDDLQDLKGILSYLEKEYNVTVYIDSKDPNMPKVTSEETARNIKNRIEMCDKFILLATNAAVDSKWCNWELGYGDAQKFSHGDIAIFPLKSKNSDYKGSEYMALYPYIEYETGTSENIYGEQIKKGLYVVTENDGKRKFIPLSSWLSNS